MSNKTWARLVNGAVAELLTIDATLVPGKDIPALWTDDVTTVTGIAVGWLKSGGSFSAPPALVPTAQFLQGYATSALAVALAAGQTFNVAASGQPALNVLCDGTSATRADLAMLYDFGQENPTGTKTWVDNNGVPTVLTGTEFISLGEQTGTWIDAGYETLGTVLTAIASTPPAITTTAQIDAAFAAL